MSVELTEPPLNKKLLAARSRNLVFTSAGERSNLKHWLTADRDFDLFVCYYGDQPNRYRELSDYYCRRKGGKFPNLYYSYQRWPEVFKPYDAIFVLDDDMLISGSGITRLFRIRQQYDLWVLQPAFNPVGKVSYPVTRACPRWQMRYVNFVEIGVPLFKKEKLEAFFSVYDPTRLIDWGIDLWYSQYLHLDAGQRAAVVDEVVCTNPWDEEKGGGGDREIDRLVDEATRFGQWKRLKCELGLSEVRPRTLGSVFWQCNLPSIFSAARANALVALSYPQRAWRKLRKLLMPARSEGHAGAVSEASDGSSVNTAILTSPSSSPVSGFTHVSDAYSSTDTFSSTVSPS